MASVTEAARWGHPPHLLTPRETLMAREQVTPNFPHTTFSVRILKVGRESLVPQPSCGEGVLRRSQPGALRSTPRASLCPPLWLSCPPPWPHRGQDVLAVALEQEALPVEGDHVALAIEGEGG